MKILEWNIHKMTKDILVKPFVYNRILEEKADIICLVEYKDDIEINNKLRNEYWIKESIASSGNQILLAIRKELAPKGIQLIRDTEELSCYNFLHISFMDEYSKRISVIGVRMLSPIDAAVQTPLLNKYLSQIKDSFVCIGDFNIKGYRMSHWFSKYKIEVLKYSSQEIENSSIVYVKKDSKIISGFGDVDHVLGSNDLQIISEYKWDFIEDDIEYPQKCNMKVGEMWDIGPAYPDHAMMITVIQF